LLIDAIAPQNEKEGQLLQTESAHLTWLYQSALRY